MLIVNEVITQDEALRITKKNNRLKELPTEAKEVYRPFWLGKIHFTGSKRNREKVNGTVVFLADARILQWSILGAYQHRKIENVYDLRPFSVNLLVENREPGRDAKVLEPTLTKEDIPTQSKLMRARRTIGRALKMSQIHYENHIEYHLIYRPYWEVHFVNNRKNADVALVSRDDILIRSR